MKKLVLILILLSFTVATAYAAYSFNPFTNKLDLHDVLPSAPASATSACKAGDLAYESGYIYVCVGTNTWQRAALATWGGGAAVDTYLELVGNGLYLAGNGLELSTEAAAAVDTYLSISGNGLYLAGNGLQIMESAAVEGSLVVNQDGNPVVFDGQYVTF